MNRISIRSRKLIVLVFLKSRSTIGPAALLPQPFNQPRNFGEAT